MCMDWPCHIFTDDLPKKCINVHRKVKLINHDCQPISMQYIMLAYLMLFAALSNVVCVLHAFFFFAIYFGICFMSSGFVLVC